MIISLLDALDSRLHPTSPAQDLDPGVEPPERDEPARVPEALVE